MAQGPEQIIADIPCVNCGYNLRMQPTSGVCPECREPVLRSLSTSTALWGSRHLRFLSRAASWIAFSALSVPVSLLLYILLIILLSQFGGPWDYTYDRYLELAYILLLDGLILLHVISVIAFTTPPTGLRRTRLDVSIFIAAALFPAAFALPTFLAMLEAFRISYFNIDISVIRYLLFTIPLSALGLPLYVILLAERMSEIYHRSGMASRKNFARWSSWIFAAGTLALIALLGGVLAIVMLDFEFFERISALEIILPLIFFGSLSLMLLGLIGILVALFRFAKCLRQFAVGLSDMTALTAPIPPAPQAGPP